MNMPTRQQIKDLTEVVKPDESEFYHVKVNLMGRDFIISPTDYFTSAELAECMQEFFAEYLHKTIEMYIKFSYPAPEISYVGCDEELTFFF